MMMKNLIVTGIMILIFFSFGCASPEMDRSYVNDAQMSLKGRSAAAEVSPMSGLNTRKKAGSSSSCSVCAQ